MSTQIYKANQVVNQSSSLINLVVADTDESTCNEISAEFISKNLENLSTTSSSRIKHVRKSRSTALIISDTESSLKWLRWKLLSEWKTHHWSTESSSILCMNEKRWSSELKKQRENSEARSW